MYALTSTGTTVKRFQNEDKSVTFGRSLGIIRPSVNSFMIVIPAVMTRNTTAKATDIADVNLKESAMKYKLINIFTTDTIVTEKHNRETLTNPFKASQWRKHSESCNEKNKSSPVPPTDPKPSFKHTSMVDSIFSLTSQNITFTSKQNQSYKPIY